MLIFRTRKRNMAHHEPKISVMGSYGSHTPYGAFFYSTSTVKNGTNAHVWTEVLSVLQRARIAGFLSPRLLIVEDNTCKENKNNTRIHFLILLVALNIFDTVELKFPCVGHSHWKIDQIFSVFSRLCKSVQNGVRDPATLEHILLTGWNQKGAPPNSNSVEFTTVVPDFHTFFKDFHSFFEVRKSIHNLIILAPVVVAATSPS